jgi:uncharacterized protein YheU (UPF0270 family)
MDASVEVPYTQLSNEALRGLAEAFVLREGTDYGAAEASFATKVDQLLVQLRQGKAKILFDPEEETCVLVPANR